MRICRIAFDRPVRMTPAAAGPTGPAVRDG